MTFVSCGFRAEGYVITNKNDTVRGQFKHEISLEIPWDSVRSSEIMLHTGSHKKEMFKITDIEKINLIKKDSIYTTYYLLSNGLWQPLEVIGNMGIYLRPYSKIVCFPNEIDYGVNTQVYFGGCPKLKYEDVAIFVGKKIHKEIYTEFQRVILGDFILKRKGLKARASEFLKFANARYGLHMKRFADIHLDLSKGFIYQKQMFDFILNKESELENKTESNEK